MCHEHGESPLSKYQLGKKVGAGAFGTVRKVTHQHSFSDCVMKTLKVDMMPDPTALKSEIELHADLDHPHVVRIFEYFDDDNHVHIVMERCEGGDLEGALSALGEDETTARAVMLQIMRAVNYLHVRMIVHRDIKPENFMVKEAGVPLVSNVLKLIDFGMAVRQTPEKHLTTICGTPEYMAPEITSGGSYDEKCDVYSCGVVLYQVLCGKTPFQSDDPEIVLANARDGTLCLTGSPWEQISGKAKLLVAQMCVRSSLRRLSAEHVLNSSWLKVVLQSSDPFVCPLSSEISERLKCFGYFSPLKRAELHKVVYRLGDDKIENCRDAFLKIDANNDGMLTLEEMQTALMANGMNSEEVRLLFEQVDSDHSGCIDYSEFLAATVSQKQYLDTQACREAFESFDLDATGYITLQELEAVLSDDSLVGAKLNHSQICEVLKNADSNGDGVIDFEEFVATLTRG